MPHFVVEYPREIESQYDISKMMQIAFDAGLESGEMGPHDLKVRAIAYDHHYMANNDETFVHITVYLLSGRTEEQKKNIGGLLLTALGGYLENVTSVSVDLQDMDRAVYTKRVL